MSLILPNYLIFREVDNVLRGKFIEVALKVTLPEENVVLDE